MPAYEPKLRVILGPWVFEVIGRRPSPENRSDVASSPVRKTRFENYLAPSIDCRHLPIEFQRFFVKMGTAKPGLPLRLFDT